MTSSIRPQRITVSRRFDLDYFRAEVCQYASGEGTSNQLAEFQYPDALKRTRLFVNAGHVEEELNARPH